MDDFAWVDARLAIKPISKRFMKLKMRYSDMSVPYIHVDRICCICEEQTVHEEYYYLSDGSLGPGGRDTCEECADEMRW